MNRNEPIWSITEVNAAVRELVENSLMPFWLGGEIGTMNIYSSGHVYLTLKDKNCQLKCTFFNGANLARRMNLAIGMQIEAYGKLSVYAQRGEYQFNIKNLRIAGAGTLQHQFEEIKNRLAAEGLFEQSRKLPLPKMPRTVGVITSADGAAIRDFVNIISRRAPYVHVKIYPSQVQGNGCDEFVMRGIEFFNRPGNEPDVLVITRGGGSMEDLWGFNSEALARSIAASRVPVVSAIGHEVDFTIADFVASLRAPTPSAAAELIAPELGVIQDGLDRKFQQLCRRWEYIYLKQSRHIEEIAGHKMFHNPEYILQNKFQKLDDISMQLEHAWHNYILRTEKRLDAVQAKIDTMDPMNVLKRGFAMIFKADNTVADVKSKLTRGERVQAHLADGKVDMIVE
ncbi:MAG: exodeoxyribonuclease VII large subunit [Lentisphaerae bacterium]|nr:exodeoxyribonuclease VII large subunit [Lentisphaerota bacterium]